MSALSPFADVILRMIAGAAPHRVFFTTVTAITAGLIAAGALWLRRSVLQKEKWFLYFGIGYTIFAFQYLFPSIYDWLYFPKPHPQFLSGFSSVASSLNNIFFLAAARTLMRHKFPWWSFGLGGLAAAIDISESFSPWHRLPDAAFSAFSLGLLGYAMFTNISPYRQRGLARIALFGGLLYAVLNVFYAFTPPLTELEIWSAPRQAIDTFLIAWALPLKVLLAAGAFVLAFRTIVIFSPKTLESSLQEINRRGTEFFVGEGFIRMIGESFKADKVALCFRLPGLRDQEVAWWEWFPGSPPTKKARVTPLPRSRKSPEASVLETGIRYERSQLLRGDPFSQAACGETRITPSKLVVPIPYREELIGFISAEWSTADAFTPTAVEQLTFLGSLFAPAIENRRRLAAIHSWVRDLQGLEFKLKASTGGYRDMAKTLAALVHETLSPMSVSLSLHVGFKPVWAVVGDAGQNSGYLDNQPNREIVNRLYKLSGSSPSDLIINRTRLEVKNSQEIGTLSMTWPKATLSGIKSRPLIFPDFLLRHTLAALIGLSLMDSTHIGLTTILNRLQIALNRVSVRTKDDWFSIVESAIKESGLLWLVAMYPSSEVPQGQRNHLELVQLLKASLAGSQEYHSRIELLRPPSPLDDTWQVLYLSLPTTRVELWLGLRNRRFGWEIRPEAQNDSPWHIFLDRLAVAADSALSRITSQDEVQRLRDEAQKNLSSTDADAFFHDCRNIAGNFVFTTQSLQESLLAASLELDPSITDDLSGLQKSARRLYDLAELFMESRIQEEGTSHFLIEAVRAAQEIVAYALSDNLINLYIDVDYRLVIDIPRHIAQHALLSLMWNSIDAIKERKVGSEIQIKAVDQDSFVLCHVIDDGPGIPAELAKDDNIFELGVSTKNGKSGRGLFLTRALLERHKGKVWLEDSTPRRTVFIIAFPKPV